MGNRAARRTAGRQPGAASSGATRGEELLKSGQFAEAEVVLRRVLARDPRNGRALVTLAGALGKQQRHDEAAACAQQAIASDPTNARAYAFRGIALTELGRSNSAIAALQRAICLGDDSWYVHNALGTALHRLGDLDASIEHLRRSAALAPPKALVHSNLGCVLADAGRFEEARVAHDAACALEPDNAWFRMNGALSALASGDLVRGWSEYDRGSVSRLRYDARHSHIPTWEGQGLDGQTVLVYREQGLGDELIFGSCYPDLVAEADHVVIECRGRLVPLLSRTFPDATVRATRDESPLPPVDVAVPAGSVPRYRRQSLADFPARGHYLVADTDQARRWATWLRTQPAPRIGVSWRSGLVTPTRRGAYPPIEDWQPLFSAPGATFVCMQYGDSNVDRGVIRQRFGIEMVVPPGLDLRDDLDGVAALAASLDSVVSVDNAVAAIAGAVGAPTAVLVPAHSFTGLGTDHWPWLPSVRTFERAPGATWEAAMAALATTITERADPTSSS